jgi:hypothetical protein
MPRDFVKYGKAGAIATVTLNRPEKFNALRDSMVRGIEEGDSRSPRSGDAKHCFARESRRAMDGATGRPQGWSTWRRAAAEPRWG